MSRLSRFIHFYTDEDEGTPVPPPVEKTIKAAIVHITDALAKPVKRLIAYINPVQDLHGYEHPWPAGGGANIWDEEWVNGYWSATTGRLVLAPTSRTIASKNKIPVQGNTQYYCLLQYLTVFQFDGQGNFTSSSVSGLFTTNADTVEIAFHKGTYFPESGDKVYNHDIAINYPATVMTYSPYSNICPISGWTGVNVTRTGFNQWDEEVVQNKRIAQTTGQQQQSITRDSFCSKNYMPCLPNMPLYVYSPILVNIYWYDADKNYITYFGRCQNLKLKAPSEAAFFKIDSRDNSDGIYRNNICINLSDPAKNGTYEPGHVVTIPISWQSSAGTVYGGTLDVTTGVLTVNMANIASYDGETLPGEWISDRDVYAAGTTPTTGAQVVYKLATPQTYQLTPTEVTTLLGQNNIWHDANGETEVTYMADGRVNDEEAANILLGGSYHRSPDDPDEATDEDALNILLGGSQQ